MANENLAIDGNTKNTLGAVTNDANQFIRRLRVNPITGALLCEANVTSSNTMIGSTIPGATEGSVFFAGAGGTLSQDNANFFWDDTDHYLGLGTDTPAATLDVEGSLKYSDGSQQDGYVLTSDASGNASWQPAGGGGGGGITSINGDTSAAQNLVNASGGYITITDTGSGNHTFGIDIAGLTSDPTFVTDIGNSLIADTAFLSNLATSSAFIDDLVGNAYFTTSLANDSNFYTTLANNTSFISALTSNPTFQGDIVTIVNGAGSSIQIDLSNQVTGILPVTHGGTGAASLTAYAPIFGGTTSTGAVQSGTVGTSGQVLTSNGAGVLPTFQTPSAGNKVAISTTQVTSSNASTTLYTVAIPGGTLGTSDAIRFRVLISSSTIRASTSASMGVSATYGGTNVGGMTITNVDTGHTATGFTSVEGYVVATGATNSQKGYVTGTGGSNQAGTATDAGLGANAFGNGTLAVDSTISQNLVISANTTGVGTSLTTEGVIVDKIS